MWRRTSDTALGEEGHVDPSPPDAVVPTALAGGTSAILGEGAPAIPGGHAPAIPSDDALAIPSHDTLAPPIDDTLRIEMLMLREPNATAI